VVKKKPAEEGYSFERGKENSFSIDSEQKKRKRLWERHQIIEKSHAVASEDDSRTYAEMEGKPHQLLLKEKKDLGLRPKSAVEEGGT